MEKFLINMNDEIDFYSNYIKLFLNFVHSSIHENVFLFSINDIYEKNSVKLKYQKIFQNINLKSYF